MDFIASERQAGFDLIASLAYAVARVWQSACEHDGVEPSCKFVVFSDDNPFVPFIGIALTQYREALAGHTAFGYAGMVIGSSGRAELYKPPRRKRKAKQ